MANTQVDADHKTVRPRIRRDFVGYALVLWFVGWTLYLIPEWSRPTGNVDWADISGSYTMSKKDGHGETHIGYPFVNYDWVDEGGLVIVTQAPDHSLTFSYQLSGGYGRRDDLFAVKKGQPWSQWLDKSFVYFEKKIGLCGILPGLTKQVCESRVTKCMDGSVQIENTQTKKGLVLFLVPFSETYNSSIILRPVPANNPK